MRRRRHAAATPCAGAARADLSVPSCRRVDGVTWESREAIVLRASARESTPRHASTKQQKTQARGPHVPVPQPCMRRAFMCCEQQSTDVKA